MTSRNAAFHEGVLAGVLLSPLKLAFSLIFGLVMSLLCAWVIDWLFVSALWPHGIERLHELLAHDLAQGIALASQQGSSASTITAPANALYAILFDATGVHEMGIEFSESAALSIPDTIVRRVYVAHREEIETAMLGTELFGVRVATLVRFAPLLLLFYAVGAADGLGRRAIRRACGGRESASLYHRAKYLQLTLLGLGGLILLLCPVPLRWHLCVSLGALLTSGLASLQWAFYKKHM